MASDKKSLPFRYDQDIWDNIEKLKIIFKVGSFNKVVENLISFQLKNLPILKRTLDETRVELNQTKQREKELKRELTEIRTLLLEKKAVEQGIERFLSKDETEP